MIRLHIICEGISEVKFVKDILAWHLAEFDISVVASAITTSKDRKTGIQHKGGISSYNQIRREIRNWMQTDKNPDSYFSTMIDFYGFPHDFPRYHETANETDLYYKIERLETNFFRDIDDMRFIPYLQLHEFEALIFADPSQLKYEYLGSDAQIDNLIRLSQEIAPEEINDNSNTAPSKRILQAIPAYDKAYAASAVLQRIGLDKLRQRCPHFNEWVEILERLK